MDTNFISKLLTGTTPSKPVILPVETNLESKPFSQNPFMIALNTDTPEFKQTYGVNRPLKKPVFLGYRDNKSLYGGARLFILC